jgi:serine/threonine-protein kinase RsbT
MSAERRLAVVTIADVERARREARALARELGFPTVGAEAVVLAVSELATNLVRYARQGRLILAGVTGPAGTGIRVASHDAGPGIADLGQALQDGYSTGGGLGGGLGSVRRLMDTFEIASGPSGTQIVAHKWRVPPS